MISKGRPSSVLLAELLPHAVFQSILLSRLTPPVDSDESPRRGHEHTLGVRPYRRGRR